LILKRAIFAWRVIGSPAKQKIAAYT